MNLEAGDPPDFVREGDSLALYRQLVRAVTDYAIYAIDPDGYVVNWNPGAERIKGYTRDEIVGEHFSRFYTEEGVASGRPALLLRIALEEGRVEDEGWRVRKDGTRFWASIVLSPIRDDDGRLCGYTKVTRDLTERRRAEENAAPERGAVPSDGQYRQGLRDLPAGCGRSGRELERGCASDQGLHGGGDHWSFGFRVLS